MSNELELKPTYWACVSGGKDSLFMLKLILKHSERYPLNGVVYWDLEIDFPFIKDVINKIKEECIRLKIPMFCIKPQSTWNELYEKYGFPTRTSRWCNSKYKMDCSRQFEQMQNQYGNSVNWYIGYCYDEKDRYEKRNKINEFYPLVDYEIEEKYILEWARKQPIYNDYYLFNDRCGCMLCPLMARKSMAYLLKYYPKQYELYMRLAKETELSKDKPFSVFQGNPKYNTDYVDNNVREKWLPKLEKQLHEMKEGD